MISYYAILQAYIIDIIKLYALPLVPFLLMKTITMDKQRYQELFEAALQSNRLHQTHDSVLRNKLTKSGASNAEIDEFFASRPLDNEQIADYDIPSLKDVLLQLNLQSSKEDIRQVQARLRCKIDEHLDGLQINVSFKNNTIASSSANAY
jgi:hypothetical protein